MPSDKKKTPPNRPAPSLVELNFQEYLSIKDLIPKGRMLYYPCSGDDTGFCINEFSNQIDTFWFADIGYARQFHRNSSAPFGRSSPLWEVHPHPIAGGRTSDGTNFNFRKIELLHTSSRKKIEAVYMGIDAVRIFEELECADKHLSVFVHRADGFSEGGSALSWLNLENADPESPGFLERVVRRIEPYGWIVSDGSNSSPFFRSESPKPFEFGEQRLVPIGQVPPRGDCPTWIWRVEHKMPEA